MSVFLFALIACVDRSDRAKFTSCSFRNMENYCWDCVSNSLQTIFCLVLHRKPCWKRKNPHFFLCHELFSTRLVLMMQGNATLLSRHGYFQVDDASLPSSRLVLLARARAFSPTTVFVYFSFFHSWHLKWLRTKVDDFQKHFRQHSSSVSLVFAKFLHSYTSRQTSPESISSAG